MTPSVGQFLERLAESRILVPGAVQTLLDGLPAASQPADARQLVRLLVERRMLTAYQARQILGGQGKSLVLGNYLILDELGQGGMGLVFKAQHRRMKRVVALKVLAPHVTRSPEAVRRFQREMEAAAHLSHPNIVTAHDADEAQETPLSGDGVCRRRRPVVARPRTRALVRGSGRLLRVAGRAGSGIRTPARRGASRHQAREPAVEYPRDRQDPGHGFGSAGIGRRGAGSIDGLRSNHGNDGLHGPRAGAGDQGCGRPVRYLFARNHALEPADRPPGLRRRIRDGEIAGPSRILHPIALFRLPERAAAAGRDLRPHGGQATRRSLPEHERRDRRPGAVPARLRLVVIACRLSAGRSWTRRYTR